MIVGRRTERRVEGSTPNLRTPMEAAMTTIRRQMRLIDTLSNRWTIELPHAEREHFTAWLADGTKVPLYCPLGMAVEIEESGTKILAGEH